MSDLHINKFNPSNNCIREVIADEGGLLFPWPSFYKEGWIQRTATLSCMPGETYSGRAGLRTRQEDTHSSSGVCAAAQVGGDVEGIFPCSPDLRVLNQAPLHSHRSVLNLVTTSCLVLVGNWGLLPTMIPLLSGLMGHSEFPPHSLRVCPLCSVLAITPANQGHRRGQVVSPPCA